MEALNRNPIVRLNRIEKNPFYVNINSPDKMDEKLVKMRTKIKLKKYPVLEKIV